MEEYNYQLSYQALTKPAWDFFYSPDWLRSIYVAKVFTCRRSACRLAYSQAVATDTIIQVRVTNTYWCTCEQATSTTQWRYLRQWLQRAECIILQALCLHVTKQNHNSEPANCLGIDNKPISLPEQRYKITLVHGPSLFVHGLNLFGVWQLPWA